jgi:hypothetical protein
MAHLVRLMFDKFVSDVSGARARGLAQNAILPTVLCIVLLGFTLRVLARLYFIDANFWVDGYTFFFELAKSIATGKGVAFEDGIPTALRVPLYPMFLAAVTLGHKELLPVVVAQSLIGAGTIWCAWIIARQMFGGTSANVAALLTAIYPYYVIHDTALQETGLFTFLTAFAVIVLLRAGRTGSYLAAATAGVLLGAAVLTRATLAPFAIAAPFCLAFASGSFRNTWWAKLRAVLLCSAVLVATTTPWLLRSAALTGSPVLSTETGYFLWLGNNPNTFSHYPRESIDRTAPTTFVDLGPDAQAEIAALRGNKMLVDRWFGRKGLEYIGAHPWLTLQNGLRKLWAAFGWLPSPRLDFWPNTVHAFSYGPVMLLGFWGMWAGRTHWRKHLVFYFLFFTFAGVTAIFFGHTSYRSYLDVYLLVFAAGFIGAHRSCCDRRNAMGDGMNRRGC